MVCNILRISSQYGHGSRRLWQRLLEAAGLLWLGVTGWRFVPPEAPPTFFVIILPPHVHL